MPFWQLTVPAAAGASDALTNFLWELGALGVVEEEAPGVAPRLRAFFSEQLSSTALLAAVRSYQASLGALGLPVDAASTEIAPLLDEAWASAWQQSFPARDVGRRLRVLPPWLEGTDEPPAAGVRVSVVIEPGRAFGTGHHGTTEGCLVLLEEARAEVPAASLLDVGTGTGILAIAALKLGAATALAIDVDPDAVAAARVNAERNGCQALTARLATPHDVNGRFAIVLANLLTHSHLALAAEYARLVGPGGQLVLGGMLAGEDARVAAALEDSGFGARSRLELEGWASLRLDARQP
ncbi:MAG TPA: 50S ribosomal protein L11 methyltransferase [Candidatus Bathyarchaeia archaeon]|nr:50S ribosomal protein L11 methyltransferase [Candidatus Bathyarchaeia archaeon]